MGSDRLPLFVGLTYSLTPEDVALAQERALGQHEASRGRGSRGGGDTLEWRLRGCIGEVSVARMLGIEPQVRVLKAPSRSPCDIRHAGFCLEVKNGLPLVWRDTLADDALYVAVRVEGDIATLHHMAWGRDIRAADWFPPAHAVPRAHTQTDNFWFGEPPAGSPPLPDPFPSCPTLGWVWDYGATKRYRCPTCGGPGRVRRGSLVAEHRPL